MKKYTFVFVCLSFFALAQSIPSPKSHFGFSIGDNYQLATFIQTEAYLKKVAAVSPRMKLQSIGKTEEGRNQYMVIVSDPANIKNLAKYKAISQKMARAEGLSEIRSESISQRRKSDRVDRRRFTRHRNCGNPPMDRNDVPVFDAQ